MRHRRYIKPVIPSDGKVSIWSENGGSQERIEVAELVGKLICSIIQMAARQCVLFSK